ncbi:MAG: hypothetical protein FJ104_17660 [Deltaproteobacteria bacterium]|nr:hypothetical protein [Deltaproteobacteria bacterium]
MAEPWHAGFAELDVGESIYRDGAAACSKLAAATTSGCVPADAERRVNDRVVVYAWTDALDPPTRNVTLTFRRLAGGEVCP